MVSFSGWLAPRRDAFLHPDVPLSFPTSVGLDGIIHALATHRVNNLKKLAFCTRSDPYENFMDTMISTDSVGVPTWSIIPCSLAWAGVKYQSA